MMKPHDLITRHDRRAADPNNKNYLGFSLAHVRFNHSRFDNVIAEIAKLHHKNLEHPNGRGLLVFGPSGSGKSYTAEYYEANFKPYRSDGKIYTPVLRVICPGTPTADGLLSAIYDALGYPIPRLTVAKSTIKLYKLIEMHSVEMMLIDEFQHVYYARTLRDFREIVDTLKLIISKTKIASVLIGLQEIDDVISTNEQTTRRYWGKIELGNFNFEDDESFKEYRALLKEFEKHLIIPPVTPLHEANQARKLLIASDGNLDYTVRVLEGAVELAGEARLNQLNDEVYSSAFKKYVWAAVPDQLNPFHPESLLRRLNQRGEPFYPWHLKHAIGSPLARRNLVKTGDK